MLKKLKYLTLGTLTFVPGLHAKLRRGTGGTTSARYCYSVWLRHLVCARRNNLPTQFNSIAELGPGDSIGIGLAALISSAERYVALDVVPHAGSGRNLAVFDELVTLFRARAPIPGPEEFPRLRPALESYAFPSGILDDARLAQALEPGRLARLRTSLDRSDGAVRYVAPWSDRARVEQRSLDLILSQAVLEHVDELSDAYRQMASWLRLGGFVSHQIDFKCHGMAGAWNGHLGYSDRAWRVMRGRLPYLLNRRVYSEHLGFLADAGFEIRGLQVTRRFDGLPRSRLAPRFRGISEDDLQIDGLLVQASLAGESR